MTFLLTTPATSRSLTGAAAFHLILGIAACFRKHFHCGPAERQELVLKLGSAEAAQMVNCNVMAFYLGAVCVAAEANAAATAMEQIAQCQVHPAPAMSSMMWKMAVRSLMCQEIRIEDLVTQHSPVQLNLRLPS